MASRMASLSTAGSEEMLAFVLTDEWCAPVLLLTSCFVMQACGGVCEACVVRATRVDAAVNDAMDTEPANPDPSRCCVTSFGGAASPDEAWGAAASPAQAEEHNLDAAALQQIVDGVRRSSQQAPRPWWLAAAYGASSDRTGQQRAGKHARVGSGERLLLLVRTVWDMRPGLLHVLVTACQTRHLMK